MNTANLAVFRSKVLALVDIVHLKPTEVVVLALRLAVEQAAKGGISSQNLNLALGDALAACAVEGNGGGDAA